MKQATTRILYNYWNDVRGTRLAPTRFEIEPSRIAPVLSETFILEEAGTDGYRFRLVGTRIGDHMGRDLRGTDFLDLADLDRSLLEKAMEAVTDDGAALLVELEADTADGRSASFEAVVMPLIHPAHRVTRYLGAFCAIDAPFWLGNEPLLSTSLVRHELIWPEARLQEGAADNDRQLPFAPEFAQARVVRSDRRQFRILDGGRKG